MIPVRLVLKDFLSYASPDPLDFTTFDIACLSGDNGVGKTALLDAITWACFGAARGCEGGMHQDRLIRDGAEEAFVEFTFILADDTYRIVRRRDRTGKGEIRFLVAHGEHWRNIAAESVKQTEAKIASVLRMDYRTFTASALFLQGRSEDFLARMKPDERKDVFARLLDLGTYERLEDAARTRAREAEARRKQAAHRADELAETAPDVDAIGVELAATERQRESAESAAAAADAAARAAREQLQALETAEALLVSEKERLDSTLASAALARKTVVAKREDLDAVNELLARSTEVSEALEAIDALRARDTEAQGEKERAADIDRRCAQITATVDADRRRLTERIDEASRKLATLEQERSSMEELRTRLIETDALLSLSGDLVASLQTVRDERSEHEMTVVRLEEQLNTIMEAIGTSSRSLEVLADGGGECPVCGGVLDREHRTLAKQRIQTEIRTHKAKGRAIRADIETARKEAARCAEELGRIEVSKKEHDNLAASRQRLAAKLERSTTIESEIDALRETLSRDEDALRADTFCAELRGELVTLTSQRQELYDAAAHEQIRERLTALRPYEALAGRLQEATKRCEPLAAEIAAGEAAVERFETDARELEGSIAELERHTHGLPEARKRVAEAEKDFERKQRTLSDLTALAARLHERLIGAQRTAEEIASLREDERATATEHRRYRRLAEAFGRGGIPDRIIDNALPELEDEANRILGALTDHEMSVRFVLQRETKSGKAKETFEALVQHEGAVRDFAMFSGGEAFRVAFAVRLAMSKLLVRRAGARLETLVIDEGFGTQDPIGRERLVEAINLARQEFAKVLVITHLEDLKDQFGTQIVVDKTSGASRLSIVAA